MFGKFKQYHFEWKHLLVLFIVLIIFQIVISYINKVSLENLLAETQIWYEQDSVEKLANLTTTSLELLLETNSIRRNMTPENEKDLIKAFNIILSQQILQHYVEAMCILVSHNDSIFAIEDGNSLFEYFYKDPSMIQISSENRNHVVQLYKKIQPEIHQREQIYTIHENPRAFDVFVPLVPYGEFVGAVYLKIKPDFTFLSRQVIVSYNKTTIIFSGLIIFGLIAMFFISAYTVKERDETQKLLYVEREKFLREHINHQKETLFSKRIYHTHHKAEKVMGFIKEDLQTVNSQNIDEIKYRITKYANFISRVIYDMKWYDPPLQAIRGPMFNTNVNEVIEFIIKHIFLRVSKDNKRIKIQTELDKNMPAVQINEFVVWEILEPLIQNSIDHSGGDKITVLISTQFKPEQNRSLIVIKDNGTGILNELMVENSRGVKRLFQENISTKNDGQKSGYGCYLAYEIAKRCGWSLDAFNLLDAGSQFIITLTH